MPTRAILMHVAGAVRQCVSAELKLALLRQRMTGVKDKSQLAELRKREQEFVSLAHIKARTCYLCVAWTVQIGTGRDIAVSRAG